MLIGVIFAFAILDKVQQDELQRWSLINIPPKEYTRYHQGKPKKGILCTMTTVVVVAVTWGRVSSTDVLC